MSYRRWAARQFYSNPGNPPWVDWLGAALGLLALASWMGHWLEWW